MLSNYIIVAEIAAGVYETVLADISKNLTRLESTIDTLSDQVEEHSDTTDLEFATSQAKLMTLASDLECVKENSEKILEDHPYECGGTYGWRRVLYLNMTDPTTNCPSGWELATRQSRIVCGRPSARSAECDSAIFPVTGGYYSSVCGSIRAYQRNKPDAFEPYNDGVATTIDSAYASGVSLTHGSPRQHIWTFAAGAKENAPESTKSCPCDATIDITIPPFVGEDYFCESGVNSGGTSGFHPDDPLWDGSGCTTSSTCCSFNNPPYFTKQLSNPTSDDIEARLCGLGSKEDTPIEFMELYVK